MFYSRVQSWCTQRVANLGLVALLILMYLAFWHDRSLHIPHDENPAATPSGRGRHHHHRERITNLQLVLVYYTLFVHFLGLCFPLRLCWAIRSTIKGLKKAGTQQLTPLPKSLSIHVPKSTGSESGYENSVCSDCSSDDIELSSTQASEWEEELIVHAIIVPNYKEDLDTLRETLDVLASHTLATSSYEIYLAMEAGENASEAKARILINEYEKNFRSIEHTTHPRDIPGESQGKSSNLCWAAKYINGKYFDEKSKKNTIVTVIDAHRQTYRELQTLTNNSEIIADSHLSTKHFSLINGMHSAYPGTAERTIYVPPIIFDRNAHLVPRLVRVADLLWAGAGLSGHYESSSICPPTSVYSLPLSLVDLAGGWDAGAEAIGEDLHMYVKCFFALNGNLTTRSVFSAASHTNVHSSSKGIRGFSANINARYKQALRHMWGALDSGYVLKSTHNMWWTNGSSMDSPHWTNTLVLIHRMFEAHFLPIHITLLVVGGGLYTAFTPSDRIPRLLLQTLDLTGYIRLVCALNFIYFFFLYESYHHTCVKTREEEMLRVGLGDRMVDAFSYRNWRKTGLDFSMFPVAGILFGTVPAVVALLTQFWTMDLVYKVSKKPQRLQLQV